ncbi:MAG: helix-turn-helix domain-containing protein [Planctomyces sp.]|nr:helix-turn-helix domain-containing protein [Planctomyces sp.]
MGKDAKQLRIDFTVRGQQLTWLQNVTFARSYPTAAGRTVSGATLKNVLRAIDSHARETSTCYVSVRTLARECNLSARTVLRALEVLRDTLLLLIEEEERDALGRRWRVHRRICWTNIDDVDVPQPPRRREAATTPCAPAKPDASASDDATPTPAPRRHEGPRLGDTRRAAQVTPGARLGDTRRAPTTYGTVIEPPPPNVADGAAAELVSLGVEWPGAALEAARSVLDEAQLAAVIAHFRQHAAANGWGVGALVQRLKHARYHDAVDRGWPRPAAAAARQAGDRRSALQADEERELERRFGRQLDALLPVDVEPLARSALGSDAALWSMFRAGGVRTALVRIPLLRALSAQEGSRCE